MGLGLELKERSEIVMEASANKENGSVIERQEEKNTECTSNLEGGGFETKAPLGGHVTFKRENFEINILECRNSGDMWLVDTRCEDSTENSSSFGHTISDVENGVFSDGEVVSESHVDAMSSRACEGSYDMFQMRRKKLTPHWRTFIQPLMWRCKWVELQIKKLLTQAVKYDRELAEYNQRKESDLKNVMFEHIGVRSLPFSGKTQRERVMRRKKRKRLEDFLDASAYMSRHNLFSYYENRPAANGASVEADWGNLLNSTDNKTKGDDFGVDDELVSLEIGNGDNSLERILWEIGCVQSRVGILKTQLNKLTSENPGMFSSTDDLSELVPCNALSSSAQKHASTSNNGNRVPIGSYIASQPISEHSMGDLIMHESAVSKHVEVTHPPDIIESKNQSKVVGSCKKTEDGILIYNRRAKEELKNHQDVQIQPTEKPRMPKEEQEFTVPSEPVFEDVPVDDQRPQKIRSISKLTAPKNKRKRGRRKAGSGRWSRRSSG